MGSPISGATYHLCYLHIVSIPPWQAEYAFVLNILSSDDPLTEVTAIRIFKNRIVENQCMRVVDAFWALLCDD